MIYDTAIRFIYFTSNQEMPRIMKRLLSRGKHWSVQVTVNEEETLKALESKPDIFLVGPGASKELIEKWRRDLMGTRTTLIEHFGGGSGLLYNEIEEYFQSKEQSNG